MHDMTELLVRERTHHLRKDAALVRAARRFPRRRPWRHR